MKKLTQKQAIFYQLHKNWRSKKHDYIAVFDFMGEVHCKELNLWGFVSHECSARTTELNQENPNLLEYIERKARAGGTYRCWRIKVDVNKAALVEVNIKKLYNALKIHERNSKPIVYCEHSVPQGALCTSCTHPIHVNLPEGLPTVRYSDR